MSWKGPPRAGLPERKNQGTGPLRRPEENQARYVGPSAGVDQLPGVIGVGRSWCLLTKRAVVAARRVMWKVL